MVHIPLKCENPLVNKYICVDIQNYICRHVQVNNNEAISFYKKFGFEITATRIHYYKRINPPDAYVLQKVISHKRIISENHKIKENKKTCQK